MKLHRSKILLKKSRDTISIALKDSFSIVKIHVDMHIYIYIYIFFIFSIYL